MMLLKMNTTFLIAVRGGDDQLRLLAEVVLLPAVAKSGDEVRALVLGEGGHKGFDVGFDECGLHPFAAKLFGIILHKKGRGDMGRNETGALAVGVLEAFLCDLFLFIPFGDKEIAKDQIPLLVVSFFWHLPCLAAAGIYAIFCDVFR